MCGLALVMGIVTGGGAVLFRALIGFIHNLMFLGHASFGYDANLFTLPSPWGAWVILVPVSRVARRHLHRQYLRTGSEGPRRSRR